MYSYFSGAGFLDLGFEDTGFDIVSVNEVWEPFMRVYRHSRKVLGKSAPRFGYQQCDINSILSEGLLKLARQIAQLRMEGKTVGFIGGPPCPDFSVAGKQAGRDGKNGQLSDTYISLVLAAQPDFFVFENVKGLWSTRRHRAYYDELKARLVGTFYMTDRLCNALEFEVPQDRERVILFGVSKSKFNDLCDFDWLLHSSRSVDEVKSLPWPTTTPFLANSILPAPEGIDETLTVEYWFKHNDVTNHPNAGRGFKPRRGLKRMQTVAEGDVTKKSYKRPHRWRYSPTVAYGNNEVHLHPYEVRRLDVAEALALQSLPPTYELPNDITLSDSFKTVGNGVPYLLAKGIAKTIQEWLEAHGQTNSV